MFIRFLGAFVRHGVYDRRDELERQCAEHNVRWHILFGESANLIEKNCYGFTRGFVYVPGLVSRIFG